MQKVARNWIEHVPDWRDEPMSYWVHVEQPNFSWRESDSYDPPAPTPEGRKGFAVLCVESQGFVFRFSSAHQLAACIDVLDRKPLPTTRRLSTDRGTSLGPNSHWLSRLPGRVKSPKARQRVVRDLRSLVSQMAPNNSFKPSPLRGLGAGAMIESSPVPLSGPA